MEGGWWECEKANDKKLVAVVLRGLQKVSGIEDAGGERVEEAGRR